MKIKMILPVVLLSIAIAAPALAQIGSDPLPPVPALPSFGTFSTSVFGYFSSFNTNFDDTFRDHRLMLWSGAESINNGTASVVDTLALSYDVIKSKPVTNSFTFYALGAESESRLSGVGGTLVSQQGGINGSVIFHDTRLMGYLDGGYNLKVGSAKGSIFGEAGLRVFKAISHNWFAGIGAGAQFPRNNLILSAQAGATF